MTPKNKERIQRLERQNKELKAQLIHAAKFAYEGIGTASMAKMMASGVVLELTALGGRAFFDPVCIRDGLSEKTIAAIREDLERSQSGMIGECKIASAKEI